MLKTTFLHRSLTLALAAGLLLMLAPAAADAQSPGILFVKNSRVGILTDNPTNTFHIFGAATADVFSGMGFDTNTGPAFNMGYSAQTWGRSSGFFNIRPDGSASAPNPKLVFATNDLSRMVIDNEGFIGIGQNLGYGLGFNPAHPIHHQSSGARLTIGGVWTNASSRALKQEITELSSAEALRAVAELQPVKFAYRADPNERHVGFVAEDVPELVASPDRSGLASMDITAVLTKVVQEQQKLLDRQQGEIERLTSSLARLEQRLGAQ